MIMMRTRRGPCWRFMLLVALFLLPTLSGCADVTTPTPTVTPTPTPEPVYDVERARAKLAAARDLWESNGSDDYTIEYIAFLYLSRVPMRLTVRNGVIESAKFLEGRDSGMLVPPENMYPVRTIDGLFDKIEEALSDRPAWSMTAEYDAELGYPREFGVSYTFTPDDYFEASICCYNPLASGPSGVDPDAPSQAAAVCLDSEGGRVACAPRDVSRFDLFSGRAGSGVAHSNGPAATVEETLEMGLRQAGASPVHIAARATADADSVRCSWRGIARTAEQREDAIRYWLGLDEDDAIPDASYLGALFTVTLETIEPVFLATATSNFMAIVEGGLSEEYLYLTCHAEYAASEYLLGTGPMSPSKLIVAYDRMGEAHSYALYKEDLDNGAFGTEPLMTEGEYQAYLGAMVTEAESSLSGIIGGREAVVFFAPMGAHNAIAVEAWQVVEQWDLQKDDDNVIHAVRYGVPEGDPEQSQTLTNLETRITTASPMYLG